jgi:hypothetical protein
VFAAVDLLTVCASLYLNRRIMGLYAGSVEFNRLWASKLSEFELLRSLAAKVNAPGTDVFDNQNFASESARILSARDRFESKLASVRAWRPWIANSPRSMPLLRY